MSDNCAKDINLNIKISGNCGEDDKKKDKCRPHDHGCVVVPVCGCHAGGSLPWGGEPGDHLVKDDDNKPVWKPSKDCDCEPVEGIPEGGNPGEVITKDEDNNTVWKPIEECECNPDALLPDGGEPNDVLTKDQDNKPMWRPAAKCECESTMPISERTYEESATFTAPKTGYYRITCVGGGGGGGGSATVSGEVPPKVFLPALMAIAL
jgi:hypothetical protein